MIVRLAILLIAAGGVLAGMRAYELRQEPLPALPAAAAVAGPATAAAQPAGVPPELQGQIENLVARPPFSPDRRPDPVEATDSTQPQDATAPVAPLNARLLGVIQDGGERFAVLATGPTEATAIVRRGGQIEGWTVETIDDKRIVLRKDKVEAEIRLFESK